MESDFSPPLTQLDAVLWFLRVQLWLSVAAFVAGLMMPLGFIVSAVPPNLVNLGLPILVLSLFPRVLAAAVLGAGARDPLELRGLLGRCVGLALFVGSLGRAIAVTFAIGYSLLTKTPLYPPGFGSSLIWMQVLSAGFSFLLGFALAFGPVIRDGLRAR